MTITLDEPLVREVIDEGLDMSWVSFTDDDLEPACGRVHPKCDRVATHKVWYQPDPTVPSREDPCGLHTSQLCEECFTRLTSTDGLVACGKCFDRTGQNFFKKIVYSERLR